MTQIQKQQFKNETDGWIGVVIIGPRGDDRGIPVEPQGTVWLSEAEQRLTANAPRRPQDNPFIAQEVERVNPETGESETVTVTPLVPISDDRFVPADNRYVPADAAPASGVLAAQAAATGDEPLTATVAPSTVETRTAEVEAMGEDAKPGHPAPPVPARAAAAAQAAAPEPEPAPEPQEPPVTPPAPPQAPEEHAVKTDPQVGEETGAATPPSGAPPEGEFAAREEVGTPVPTSPPTTAAEEQAGPPQPPVPYSPGATQE
jgi:hypothetical protein